MLSLWCRGSEELDAGLWCARWALYPLSYISRLYSPSFVVPEMKQSLPVPLLLSCVPGPSLRVLPSIFRLRGLSPWSLFAEVTLIFTCVLVACDCPQASPTWWLKMPEIDSLTGLKRSTGLSVFLVKTLFASVGFQQL